MIRFDPQPSSAELPERMPSPSALPPHSLAVKAAEALKRELSRSMIAGVDLSTLDRPGFGKMFGVLVVADRDGEVGYLRAFSGMLDGKWEVEGFAPPTFDAVAKASFWPQFEAALDADGVREAELERRLREGEAVEDQLASLRTERAERSRSNWQRVTDTYRLSNARGEVLTVTQLFSPLPPPGAAGDCAGPKLLADAYRRDLRPIAFAEFWWGAPSTDGERTAGDFYPACDRRCRVVLPFMLQGLEVEPAPPLPETEALEILFEDDWVVVAVKPAGLPAKPGGRGRDSVLSRLRTRLPSASLVYAPTPDQGGLVLAAKDSLSLAALQRSFGRGEARKELEAQALVRLAFPHPATSQPQVFTWP